MARKTKEEALETRNLILDAAQKVFSSKGVAHTSLNDIARAAGVTRGAIYWHFQNKADLFNAMLERVILPIEEFVFKINEQSIDDPVDYLRQCCFKVMHSLIHEARALEVFEIIKHKVELTGDMLPARERSLQGRQDCISRVMNGLENAQAKGLVRPEIVPEQAAIGLHCIIDGLISNWVLDPQAFDLQSQADFSINTFIESLLIKSA